MRKRILCYLVFLVPALASAQFYADQVVDAGPCDPIIPLVCPGGVNDAQNAVDADRENFALLRADVGLISTAFLELGFSQVGTSSDLVHVDLQLGNDNLNVDVLQSMTITVFDSQDSVVAEKSNFGLTDLGLISGNSSFYRFTMSVDSSALDIAKVRIQITGLLNVLNDLRVFNVFYTQAACPPVLANNVFSSAQVQNPENAVSANVNDFALMSIPLGIASEGFIDLSFDQAGKSGDYVGFEIEPNNTSLSIGLVNTFGIEVYDPAGNLVDAYEDFQVDDLVLLANTSDRYTIGFYTNQDSSFSISRIRFVISPLLATFSDLRIYNGFYLSNGGNIEITTNTGEPFVCDGASLTLNAGGGFDSYLWSTGETGSSITITEPGIYSVSADSDSSCLISGVIVIQSSDLSLVVNTIQPDCGQANGSIDVSVSGGTGNYLFAWSSGQDTEDLNGIEAGLYELTVTDSIRGCILDTILAVPNEGGPVVNFDVTDSDCGSANGSIELFVEGNAPFVYNWQHGPNTATVTNLASGVYYVEVIDADGCKQVRSIFVGEKGNLSLSATVDTATCDSTNGAIDLSVTGGSGDYAFLWSSGQTTEDLTGIPGGLYQVEVTDNQNGCASTLQVEVPNLGGPEITIVSVDQISCFGANDGRIEISYEPQGTSVTFWSTGEVGPDFIDDLGPGEYWVRVEDFNNDRCFNFATFTIVEPKPLVINAEVFADCEETEAFDGAIDVIVNGGTAPYTYVWSNGETSSSIENLEPGIYDLNITDDQGCELNRSFTVGQKECDSNTGGPGLGEGEISNVFTPNGDGFNDTWNVAGLEEFPNHKVEIFNRWGTVVYNAAPFNGWDGTFQGNGDPVPVGTYFYVIEFGDNSKKNQSGYIEVIR